MKRRKEEMNDIRGKREKWKTKIEGKEKVRGKR